MSYKQGIINIHTILCKKGNFLEFFTNQLTNTYYSLMAVTKANKEFYQW